MTPFGRVPLSSIAEVVRGVTYEKSAASMVPKVGYIPLLRATNINNTLTFDDLVYVPEAVVSSGQRLRRGDIVVATSSGSLSVVGKSAPLLHDWHGTFGAFCAAIRPRDDAVDPLFLANYLRTTEYRYTISSLAAGVNINNLKRDHLESFLVPIAPLGQQRVIAEAIDSYVSRLDEATTLLDRVERNLKRYRASVLKAAVEGRLAPTEAELARAERRDYEPASVLLKRILVDRRRRWEAEGKRGKYEEPKAPDTKELPELPKGWCWATVQQLCASVTDGDHQPPPQVDSGVPFLVIGNVRDGEVSFEGTRFVANAYYDGLDPARRPQKGDVLYTVTGSFGIPVLVRTDEPFCVQRHIAILRPLPATDAVLLLRFLGAPFFFKQAAAIATGIAQMTVPLQGLRRLPVPLPPAAEHKRIVAQLELLLSTVEVQQAAAAASLMRCTRLRQSILKWAFEGKLVDQDPNDEAASALLARIKNQKSVTSSKAVSANHRFAKRKS